MNSNIDSSMAVYAFRYCLGRKTYCVSDCVNWLIANWYTLEKIDQTLIVKEINEAFNTNNYGMDIDKREWERLLDFVHGGH